MTPAQVRAAIAAGTVAPMYLLESDDVPSRLELSQAFLGLVEEGLEAFNTASFHGRDAATAGDRDTMYSAILSAARTLPMMAPRRVLLVHDAEALLAPKRAKDDESAEAVPAGPGKRRARNTTPAEDFEAYVEHPEPMTTLVLDVASLDRNRRITKLLLKHALVVDCGTLDTAADAARWIKARLDRDEMTMDGAAIGALIDATGLRLPRIRSAIDSLVLYAAGEGAITAAHVRDVVIPVEEPGEDFALGKAIWNGNPAAALREIDAQFDAGAVAPMVLGQIRAAAIRLRPDSRARQALRTLLDADLAIKSSQGEPRFVLERLVVEICDSGPAGGPPVRRPWA